MVTYNHESYIAQAIDSVLMQQTNFEFHLFIGEDCSTDDTSNICKKYAEKYSDKITLFAHKHNIGAANNGQIIYKACFESNAKYVAMLEGDDYWTDPLKLQKQVDFLEADGDYICVGGKVTIKDSRNEFHKLQYDQQYFTYNGSQQVPKEDILDKLRLPFHTSTYLFKKDSLDLNLFEISFKQSISGDIPILNMLNARGKIFYMDEEFGVKHHNSGGITNMTEHKGLNFLWNRVYMWEQISKLYDQKDLRNLAYENKKYFNEIFTKKFLNVNLADQMSFLRNSNTSHHDLVRVILKTLVQKGLLKLGLKR
jgi:glycosyltransferase involved in cell wall biosynthesis